MEPAVEVSMSRHGARLKGKKDLVVGPRLFSNRLRSDEKVHPEPMVRSVLMNLFLIWVLSWPTMVS